MMHRMDMDIHHYRRQYYKTANRHRHARANYGYNTNFANRDYFRAAGSEPKAKANSDDNKVLALHTSLICFKVALCFLLP